MKKIFVIVTALVSAFLPSSCNKEQSAVDETITTSPELKTYTLTIEASKAPSTKQLVLDGTGNTLNAVWAKGEVVKVYYGGNQIGTISPYSSGSANTILTGDVTVAGLEVGHYIDLVFGGDLSGQDGSLANIHDWAKAWFKVGSTDGGKITPKAGEDCVNSDGCILFNNWTSIVRFNLQKKSDSSDLSASKMVIKTTNQGTEGSYDNMLTVIPGESAKTLYVAIANLDNEGYEVSDDYEIFVYTSDGIYSCKTTGKTFEKSKFYDITLKMSTHAYRLAGSPASVFTTAWSTDESANDMEYDSASGLYKIVYEDVPGDVNNIALKPLVDGSYAYAGDNYAVNYSATGYSRTLTVTYDPVTVTTSHTLTQNTSPYKMYVLQEGLAASTNLSWGSTRSVECNYNFISLPDATFGDKTYKCYSIPDVLVDGTTDHSIDFKGDNNCKVSITKQLSEGTKNYYFRTNGILYTEITEANKANPTAIPDASTPRIWACVPSSYNVNDLRMWIWGGSSLDTTGTYTWGNMKQMTKISSSLYDNCVWFYLDVPSGDQNKTFSWKFVWNNASEGTTDINSVRPSSSVYFKVKGNNTPVDSISW